MPTKELLNIFVLSLIRLISLWEIGWGKGEGEDQKGDALFLILKQASLLLSGGNTSHQRWQLELASSSSVNLRAPLRGRGYGGRLFQ